MPVPYSRPTTEYGKPGKRAGDKSIFQTVEHKLCASVITDHLVARDDDDGLPGSRQGNGEEGGEDVFGGSHSHCEGMRERSN